MIVLKNLPIAALVQAGLVLLYSVSQVLCIDTANTLIYEPASANSIQINI